ncbi:MAG: M20/M25/M40 family metallo-hydrolase [Bdellovibrionota bacterium]
MRKFLIPFLSILVLSAGLSYSALSGAWNMDELKLLSSPEFEGRGVGTKGLEKARDLLVARLQALGIEGGIVDKDGNRTYLEPFRVFVGNELGADNHFADSNSAEFMPLAFSHSGSVPKAQLVFVGFGISLRETDSFAYDDYSGMDVKDKIVVALLGDPGTGNKESPFRNPAYYTYSSAMYKVQNAERHGAAGIVLVRDPLSLDNGVEAKLQFQPRQGGGATSDILAGQASIAFVQKMLGRNLLEIQRGIAASQKPNSFAVESQTNMSIDLQRQLGDVQNVVGFIPGNDPAVANEYLVLGAHYDHLGYGGDFSMDPNGAGKIHPGADDNASGDQAVLHLAEQIKNHGGNRRGLVVIFFTAEEIGLLGSRQFTETLPLPEGAHAVGMINLDMVGRLNNNRLTVLALKSSPGFSDLVDSVNKDFSFDLARGDSGFGSSDHASFLAISIPSLFFTTGTHEDYHRPSDTSDKINGPGMERVEQFVHGIWNGLDQGAAPVFDPKGLDPETPPREGRGYGAYFGSVPDFEQGPIDGVLITGVNKGSPAEKSGLQAKDLLVGLGEIKIKNLYDFVFALRFYRPNEEIEVRWLREGVAMSGKTTLKPREVEAR